MADLEQSIAELESVKQNFKSNINAMGVSTSSIEFRNYPSLMNQLEKKLPSQTKNVTPTESSQLVSADAGYKLSAVNIGAIPSDYIIPIGTLQLNENKEYDVTKYAKVKVSVAGAGGSSGLLEEYNATIYTDENGYNVLALDNQTSTEKNYVVGQLIKDEYSTLYLVNA